MDIAPKIKSFSRVVPMIYAYNTPGIIKYLFWQMTAKNPNAVYTCINKGEAYAPEEIMERSICINRDIGAVIGALRSEP